MPADGYTSAYNDAMAMVQPGDVLGRFVLMVVQLMRYFRTLESIRNCLQCIEVMGGVVTSVYRFRLFNESRRLPADDAVSLFGPIDHRKIAKKDDAAVKRSISSYECNYTKHFNGAISLQRQLVMFCQNAGLMVPKLCAITLPRASIENAPGGADIAIDCDYLVKMVNAPVAVRNAFNSALSSYIKSFSGGILDDADKRVVQKFRDTFNAWITEMNHSYVATHRTSMPNIDCLLQNVRIAMSVNRIAAMTGQNSSRVSTSRTFVDPSIEYIRERLVSDLPVMSVSDVTKKDLVALGVRVSWTKNLSNDKWMAYRNTDVSDDDASESEVGTGASGGFMSLGTMMSTPPSLGAGGRAIGSPMVRSSRVTEEVKPAASDAVPVRRDVARNALSGVKRDIHAATSDKMLEVLSYLTNLVRDGYITDPMDLIEIIRARFE